MSQAPTPSARTYLVHLGDQRRSRTDSHGIINFSLGLVRALPEALAPHERLVVLANEEIAAELGSGWSRPQDHVRPISTPGSVLARLRIDHGTVVATARDVGADAVLSPKGFLPLRPRALRAAAQVVCLHDDIPFRQVGDRSLGAARRLRAGYFSAMLRWSLRTADTRLFVSGFTARLLQARSAERPTDVVVGEGISLPPRPLLPLADRQRQAVMLGSPHPHKRTAAGLDLLLGDERCTQDLDRVVVVGGHAPSVPGHRGLVVEHRPGPLTGESLADLVAGSRLLVFPSSYEGFGLPPIEAYALGTPAAYRRTDAAREVLAGVPGGFDAEDPDDFAAAVDEALSLGDGELATWSRAMWTRFDWATVAARVAAALRQAVGDRQA